MISQRPCGPSCVIARRSIPSTSSCSVGATSLSASTIKIQGRCRARPATEGLRMRAWAPSVPSILPAKKVSGIYSGSTAWGFSSACSAYWRTSWRTKSVLPLPAGPSTTLRGERSATCWIVRFPAVSRPRSAAGSICWSSHRGNRPAGRRSAGSFSSALRYCLTQTSILPSFCLAVIGDTSYGARSASAGTLKHHRGAVAHRLPAG